jgi:hypothetical protein
MAESKAKYKTDPKPGKVRDQTPPVPSLAAAPPNPEPDVPPELTLAEHYRGFSVQELATAATQAQDALAAVERELATADDWLAEAIKRDEQEFSEESGGPKVAELAPHYAEAQQKLAGLIPKRWALQRRASALSLAARMAEIVSLEQEIQGRAPRIRELEGQIATLQRELEDLRYEQTDAVNERRTIQINKHESEDYRTLSAGPSVRGLAAALLGGNNGGAVLGPGWSRDRLEF